MTFSPACTGGNDIGVPTRHAAFFTRRKTAVGRARHRPARVRRRGQQQATAPAKATLREAGHLPRTRLRPRAAGHASDTIRKHHLRRAARDWLHVPPTTTARTAAKPRRQARVEIVIGDVVAAWELLYAFDGFAASSETRPRVAPPVHAAPERSAH